MKPSQLFSASSKLIRQQLQNKEDPLFVFKPEISADNTNADDVSIGGEGADGMEVEQFDEKQDEMLKDLGFRKYHQMGFDCSEEQGNCENTHSEEKIKLMVILGSQQKMFLEKIRNEKVPLTHDELIKLLAQQKEMLTSAHDCLTARAESAVMKAPAQRKRIIKKTRTSRKRTSRTFDITPASDGFPILLLPEPAEVNQTNEQLLNNSFEDYEFRGGLDFQMSPHRILELPEGTTDDDVYGMKRLEAEDFERNLYFGLSESMLEFPDFD